MKQQIISIHVGQCGVQMGSSLWELLTFEHSLTKDGLLCNDEAFKFDGMDTIFTDCRNGKHVPKAIFVDLEPTVIDEVKNGPYWKLFHPDQFINGHEDAANNFARAFYGIGRMIKAACFQQIRREIERSDNLQAIHLYRALGGGTGSGMMATLFEILSEYSKITKLEVSIHPSPNISSATVEPYNSILSEHFSIDDVDMSFLMDNEALYDIITVELLTMKPTFCNINRVLAQVCSSVSSSTRFRSDLYNDVTVLTNLVPYPRIHFPVVSYAPFGTVQRLDKDSLGVSEITNSVFRSGNQMVKCDPSSGKSMSCSLLYRGGISPTEVFPVLAQLKASGRAHFVDWCPTGFKVGIVSRLPQHLPDSAMGSSPTSVLMLSNSSAVSSVWHRLSQRFHRLYSKRSFVHWFVAEGLEEDEFSESLYNIATLAKDYEEVSIETVGAASADIFRGAPCVSEPRLADVAGVSPAICTEIKVRDKVNGQIEDGCKTKMEEEVKGVIISKAPPEEMKGEDDDEDKGVNDDEEEKGGNNDEEKKDDDNVKLSDKESEGTQSDDEKLKEKKDEEGSDASLSQENTSNFSLFDRKSSQLAGDHSVLSRSDVKRLFQALKWSCEETTEEAKARDKDPKRRARSSRNTSGLNKRISMRKCTQKKRCSSSVSHRKSPREVERNTWIMMDQLIKITERETRS